MRDDTVYQAEDVKEAVRRLPGDLYNDRMLPIKRALDLTMRYQILSMEQWTKYEEDQFYLEPSLKERSLSKALVLGYDLSTGEAEMGEL
uniref:Cytochrome b-c1 complex subunit 7 n=1 Tax=Peromyscus maniculatus bairdii TaxID=230844 RepID=A0A8C8U7M8_PERMB